jgi:DNA repair exonuclease SbcCD ATPase subunit
MTDKIKDIINNFSDMKIIKALECCIIGDCDNCPFYETRELCPNLILFVSDLIERQKAEIEMDDAEIKELRIALQGYLDDVAKTRNLYKKSIEELNQAKAEIERLKATVDSFTDIGKLYSEIKSEAYKEFAERLKEMASRGFWETDDYVGTEQIDNLLKELVSDSNG